MASEFVRKVKGIRNIDILSPNITTENDLISTIDGEVYVATNKGYRRITGVETKDIKQLKTDVSNLKIQSDTNTLTISDNTDDIETNTSEIETLKTSTDNNTSEIETLKTSTDNNTSEIETLKTSTDNNTSEIETLKTDTSKHQKYKLTESNGKRIRVSDIDPVELDTGYYQIWHTYNMPPETDDGSYSYWNVDVLAGYDNTKQILAVLSGSGKAYLKNIHKGVDSGWKELTGNNTSEIETLKTSTGNNTSEIETLKSEIETLKKDTSNWQKYKLTENNGDRITKTDVDVLTLESGFFECWNITGVPHHEGSRWFIDISKLSKKEVKIIKATLGYTGDVYQRTIYGSSDSGWKELTGLQDLITRIEALENADTTT